MARGVAAYHWRGSPLFHRGTSATGRLPSSYLRGRPVISPRRGGVPLAWLAPTSPRHIHHRPSFSSRRFCHLLVSALLPPSQHACLFYLLFYLILSVLLALLWVQCLSVLLCSERVCPENKNKNKISERHSLEFTSYKLHVTMLTLRYVTLRYKVP